MKSAKSLKSHIPTIKSSTYIIYRVNKKWRNKTTVIALVAFSFLYNTPRFFELYTIVPRDLLVDISGTEYKSIKYGFGAKPFRHNFYYFNIYCMWITFFAMGLIPFAVLIVLKAMILKVIFTNKVNNKYK